MKKYIFSFIIGLLAISATACTSEEETVNNTETRTEMSSTPSEETPTDEPEAMTEETAEEEMTEFDTLIEEFNTPYKGALMSTNLGEKEKSQELISKAKGFWKVIDVKFREKQPEKYKKTQLWKARIGQIERYLQKSEDFTSQDKLAEAHEELEGIRKTLKIIREESDAMNLSDYMLIFHDTMEVFIEEEEKNEKLLAQLKKELTPLKERKTSNEEYQENITEIESILNTLETLEGEEYRTELQKLKPAFQKLKPAFQKVFIPFG